MKSSLNRKKFFLILTSFLVLFIFCLWENNFIVTTNIKYESNKIPNKFHNYKILQLSDLHNKQFGKNQNKLLNKIQDSKADIIVITGDLIDSNNTNIDVAIKLIKEIVKIAPVYYVSGNHEAWSKSYTDLKLQLEEYNVVVLDNATINISKNGDIINLIGLSDTAFPSNTNNTEKILNNLISDNNDFKILLSHRPELFNTYCNTNIDLVFSGHAHGGQFRLPFVGGIIAPDQGLFPKLTEGIHKNNDTSIVISRGLGNSIIPIRLFNRPEIIVVTLSNE